MGSEIFIYLFLVSETIMTSFLLKFINVPFRKMPPKELTFTGGTSSHCAELLAFNVITTNLLGIT